VNGATALPEGSAVNGVVTDAKRSGKVKGRAHVALRFDSVIPRGDNEDDAVKIGGPAIGGAIVGGIIGGKKGAVIGTLAGGGAGTAVVLSTRGKEVHLGKREAIRLKLVEPLTIRVRS
jgi:uncharacterized membrane protein